MKTKEPFQFKQGDKTEYFNNKYGYEVVYGVATIHMAFRDATTRENLYRVSVAWTNSKDTTNIIVKAHELRAI